MTDTELPDALNHWRLNPPLAIGSIARGTNNVSFLVRSGTGRFVLKCSQAAGGLERSAFEQALVRALADEKLPFSVPSPVQTISGGTSVELARGAGVSRFTLFHHIPGHAARFGNHADAFRCGVALAFLDQALDAVRLDPTTPVPDTFGDLHSIHPAVPDPAAAIHQLSLDHALATTLMTVVSLVEEQWQQRTSGWKVQLIHSDFYPSNALMESGEVTGILDFEFAGTGHRAMDFAIGLGSFSTRNWDDGCAWPLVDSFAQGYLRRTPLSSEELAAVPMLLRFREATSFIHWLGRSMRGPSTVNDIHARARRLLALDRWLTAHQGELVNRLERIAGP
ncbi:MAG: phosphotransferase [Thermomicrobiales bacterium]